MTKKSSKNLNTTKAKSLSKSKKITKLAARHNTYASATKSDYWFKAKQFGWGWGLPANTSGWLTFGVYIVVVVLLETSFFRFDQITTSSAVLRLVAPTIGLVYIVVKKGEPTKWSWSKK
jgi:hypothetical protein